jgi:transcriptional regulator with XRE-family HTH domain
MVTGAQVRMARAFLRWSAVELAEESGISVATIQRIEADDGFPASRGGNIEAVHKALTGAGITFLPDSEEGVGIRGKLKTKRGK